MASPVEIGEDICEEGSIKVYRSGSRYRIRYERIGAFDILDDGLRINGYLDAAAEIEVVQMCIVGRVFALAVHAAGGICLHGSAVRIGRSGVAFLAPSGSGKSTLATALVKAGAELLGDDAIPVSPGPPALVHPGVASVRLRGDSSQELAMQKPDTERGTGNKLVFRDFPLHQVSLETAPLEAIYLLHPHQAEATVAPVARIPLPPGQSSFLLLRNIRVGSLLGGDDAAKTLRLAATLASAVPVFTLRIVRDFAHLSEAVTRILEWHEATLPLEELAS